MTAIAGQSLRFLAVGGAATLVHVATAIALVEAAGWSILFANIVAFAFAVLVSYLGNHRWTFGRAGRHDHHLPRFIVLALGGLALNQAIVFGMVRSAGIDYRVALMVVVAVVPALSFVLNKVWAFAAAPPVRVSPDAKSVYRPTADQLAFAGLMAVAWAVALVLLAPTTLHHDINWYLVATGRMLDGARLYVDIIEVNPPLSFVLTVPAVVAARLTGLAAQPAFVAYVFVLIGLSLQLAARQLAALPGTTPGYRRAMIVAAFVALTVCPISTFGQREHLMVILTLPYVLLFAVRLSGGATGRGTAIGLAVVAAFGFALKPYFLVVPMAFELYLAVRSRSPRAVFRPETWTLGIAMVAYLVSIAVFTPAYLERIVPYALLVYDDAFMQPFATVLGRPETVLLPIVLVLHLITRGRQGRPAVTDAFALAAIGFFIAYLAQQKGWSYQIIPTAAMLVMMVAGMLLADRARTARNWRSFALMPIAALTLAMEVGVAAGRGTYRNELMESLLPIVRTYASGGAIYAFSANVAVGFPLANTAGVEWASRYPTQWLLPGAVRRLAEPERLDAASLADLRAIERYAVRSVIEDLERGAPEIVIVDRRVRTYLFGAMAFDYLGYFAGQPGFAEIWRNYDRIERIDDIEIWRRAAPDRSPPPDRLAGAGLG